MITVRVTTPDDQIITRINATLQEAKEYYVAHLGLVTVEEIKEEKEIRKMKKYTQRELKEMVATGIAQDISYGTEETRQEILKKEGHLTQIGYAAGVYGCSGQLFEGYNTGTLYAITRRTQPIFIIGKPTVD